MGYYIMQQDNSGRPLTLLAVHAHPDDEVFGTGGVYAKAAAEGKNTILVCSTQGEQGEIHDAALDTPGAYAALAATREEELRRACAILGINALYFLGYHDSGMAGTPENANPESFLQADLDEAAGRIVRILRETRPDVVVTYDPGGSYGHPDHITAHRATVCAIQRSGDPSAYPEHRLPPWNVPKFYYAANPASTFRWLNEQIEQRGLPNPFRDPGYDITQFFTPDEEITTRVDVRPYLPQKLDALFVHATQIGPDDLLRVMPEDMRVAMLGTESFIRVHSCVPGGEPETDLFAGLRQG